MEKAARKRRWVVAAGVVAAAFALYAWATWPVLREFGRAIPYTNENVEAQTVVPLRPGDHLQLLYHFWLGKDALAGRSPFFTNVYEFNLGTDEGHGLTGAYYLPFSAVYMALSGWLGNAAGWNAAQACAGVLGTVFLALWARRFTRGWGAATAAAVVAGAVPYRWVTLLCGSPTGLGMAFPPLLAWGIDRAVRGGERAGWAWAVVAMGCAWASDLHVFYFSALAAPALAGMSLWAGAVGEGGWRGAWGRAWRGWAGLWPLWAVLGAAAAWAVLGVRRDLSGSVMKTGRTIFEMANYSPRAEGVFGADATGMARHVYLGWPLAVLAVMCAALGPSMVRWRADAPRVRGGWAWAWVALCAGVVLLGLGINAPPAGMWARAARKLVPGYSMIRQTAKAYGVLPTLLAPLLAAGFSAVFERGAKRGRGAATRAGRLVPGLAKASAAVLAVAAALDGASHTRAGLTVLPDKGDQGRGIVAAARAAGDGTPRALAIPLWPGDSHWSSLYEYATVLSGVRWVNGYAPMTPEGYFERVFKKFEPLNQGVADDARLDELLAMGVRYVEVFPRAFPEKVSPWPPAATVRRLTANPRLEAIWGTGSDEDELEPSFAFRILTAEAAAGRAAEANWDDSLWPAAIHWKYPKDAPQEVGPGGTHSLVTRAPIEDAPNRRVVFRVAPGSAWPRGEEFRGEQRRADAVDEDGLPEWESVPMESPRGEVLEAGAEGFSLEHAYVAAGEAWLPGADGVRRVPPALMWHGGRMRPGRPEVEFLPEATAAGVALYGPQLPVPAGRWRGVARFKAAPSEEADEPAEDGEPVGSLRVVSGRSGAIFAEAPLRMGDTMAETEVCALPSDPIRLEVVYEANAALVVEELGLVPAE
jgi:hypothetical protein